MHIHLCTTVQCVHAFKVSQGGKRKKQRKTKALYRKKAWDPQIYSSYFILHK